ncbi:LD-carboxypeptidase [Dactylosporangium vinaceum]|uniref:LD-carboxypeptidase n=1 Tax=Dactylosporangium vinaceum TaxID=53362 RepID=A0ABV5MTG6_9ACTN|nr:LD-carboxypeptidase [Dactylosporangium vinaceum]
MTEQAHRSMSRRDVLRSGAVVAGGVALGATTGASPAGAEPGTDLAHGPAIRPPALKPGDRVRIVAPAYPGDGRLVRGQQVLESFGLVVEYGTHVYDQFGYLAGTDADRLADLNAAFRDPGVRCVFGARGGYGTQRIIDGLDVAAARRDPKIFIGFSDLTVLHCRLWRAARLVSLYGPLATWTDTRTGPESVESLRKALMTTDPIVVTRDPAEPSSAVSLPGRGSGVASGPLLGGNLTMIQASIGTADLPSLEGAILLFEDTGEAPYSYDRMLTHLRRAGVLRKLAGVAIGQFNAAGDGSSGWSAAQAVTDRLADLGVPVLGGLHIGHGNGQLTVPIGARATIDTAAGTLTVEPGVR